MTDARPKQIASTSSTPRRRARLAAGLLVMGVPSVAACGESDLATSCGSFLKKDAAGQESLALEFTRDDGFYSEEDQKPLFDRAVTENLQLLRDYCPSHEDDKLEDLTISVGRN